MTTSTEGYRNGGIFYHYAPPTDYITIRNADIVAKSGHGLFIIK